MTPNLTQLFGPAKLPNLPGLVRLRRSENAGTAPVPVARLLRTGLALEEGAPTLLQIPDFRRHTPGISSPDLVSRL